MTLQQAQQIAERMNAHPVDPSTLTPDKEKAILCAMYAIWKKEIREGKTDLTFEEWLKSG